jgi:hypothetical protein
MQAAWQTAGKTRRVRGSFSLLRIGGQSRSNPSIRGIALVLLRALRRHCRGVPRAAKISYDRLRLRSSACLHRIVNCHELYWVLLPSRNLERIVEKTHGDQIQSPRRGRDELCSCAATTANCGERAVVSVSAAQQETDEFKFVSFGSCLTGLASHCGSRQAELVHSFAVRPARIRRVFESDW